jgi:multicomponent Na+:H+ antiporter subunit B
MSPSGRSGAIRAGRPGGEHSPEPEALHRPALAGLLAFGMAICLVVALVGLPHEDAHLPAVARQALALAVPRWHITEPVNEIVYGTRGIDTFGETFLLLAAVVSVMTLTRRRESRHADGEEHGEERAGRREQEELDPPAPADADQAQARVAERNEEPDGGGSGEERTYPDDERLGAPSPERAEAMSVVTRTAARAAAPLLAVGGVYLAAEGYAPGGGFPAGAVILGVILMLWAGFGHERMGRSIQQRPLEALELAGALAIVGIEVLGLVIKGSVSANWLPLAKSPTTIFSGGVIQAFSGSELIEVATGLTLAVFSLLAMRHDWTPDDEADSGREAGRGGGGRGAAGRGGDDADPDAGPAGGEDG